MKNRVFKNASWIIGLQIAKAIIGLIISMLTARYLGPSNYGLINYAASVVTFVVPVMYLGLNSTLVQEIVLKPDREGETVGTAMGMSLFSSILCFIGVVSFTLVANPGEIETSIVCGLYSLLLIFQSLDLIQYWFQAKLLSKYSSMVSLIAYVIVSAYKVFLLATGKNIYWFAVANVLDYAIISFALIAVYHRVGTQKLKFNPKLIGKLFSKSKYYIIANLAVSVFVQTDRIMLKIMYDDTLTGFYSAAATCAGITSFVFAAIISSFHPVIFEYKEENQEKYEKTVCTLYSIVIYAALLQCLVFTFFSPLIIHLLYGDSYAPASGVLQVLGWYTVFSYVGSVRNIWMLAEDKQKYIWVLNVIGAAANILLNLCLIPLIGAVGAALASLVTQFFTNVVLGFIIKPIRHNNTLMLRSLHPRYILYAIKSIR